MKLFTLLFSATIIYAGNYGISSNDEINLKFEACKDHNELNKVLVDAKIIEVGGGVTLQSYTGYYASKNLQEAVYFYKKYIVNNEDIVCRFSEDMSLNAEKKGLIFKEQNNTKD